MAQRSLQDVPGNKCVVGDYFICSEKELDSLCDENPDYELSFNYRDGALQAYELMDTTGFFFAVSDVVRVSSYYPERPLLFIVIATNEHE